MQIKFSAEPTGDAIAYLCYEGDKGVEFAADLDKPAESAIRRAIAAGSFKGGSGQTSTEQKIANEFYMAYLNSVGNQINLDLEILGDPFFLPEVGYSNFHSDSNDQVT